MSVRWVSAVGVSERCAPPSAQAVALKLARDLWPRLLSACQERRSGTRRVQPPVRVVVGWREGYASLGSDGANGGGSMHTATSPWPPTLANALHNALTAEPTWGEAANGVAAAGTSPGGKTTAPMVALGDATVEGDAPAVLAAYALRTLRARLPQVRPRSILSACCGHEPVDCDLRFTAAGSDVIR